MNYETCLIPLKSHNIIYYPEHILIIHFNDIYFINLILFAMVGNLFENLIQLINIIGSLFYGTILGIFLIAIFIKFIRGKAVFFAAIISEIMVLYVYKMDIVSFLWLNVIGAILTIMLAIILQVIFKETVKA